VCYAGGVEFKLNLAGGRHLAAGGFAGFADLGRLCFLPYFPWTFPSAHKARRRAGTSTSFEPRIVCCLAFCLGSCVGRVLVWLVPLELHAVRFCATLCMLLKILIAAPTPLVIFIYLVNRVCANQTTVKTDPSTPPLYTTRAVDPIAAGCRMQGAGLLGCCDFELSVRITRSLRKGRCYL
jgi:hypothetical protein